MSLEDLGRQLNAAYLNKVVDQTLAQLDQVVRDRENQTPEVEFDKEHPPHSFKFECKQISTWFENQEVDTLRETIQDTHYWMAEAHVLLQVLTQKISSSLEDHYHQVLNLTECMAQEFALDEMDDFYEKMNRMSQWAHEAIVQFQVHMESKWALETARTASQWQEATSILHRIAKASGLSLADIQKTRHDITDERYWQCEVEVLKPYRHHQEYKTRQQQSGERRPLHGPPKLAASVQFGRALKARTHSSRSDLSQRRNERVSKIAKTRSSTLKSKSEPSERRRSARLQQLAKRNA